MKFTVIGSGSKGNSTLVYSHNQAILLDFGVSKKRVVNALKNYGLEFEDIEAFLITHSHGDHCSDLFNAPIEKIYCTVPKFEGIDHVFSTEEMIKTSAEFKIGIFNVTVFPLSHDAPNTVGYLIDDGEETLVYLTDTGFIPEKNFPLLRGRTYYVFEANHDIKMLYNSSRPEYLIRRIISDKGHLSNTDSGYYLSLFIDERKTKEVVLSHLSDLCNTEELALKEVKKVIYEQLGYIPENVRFCCAKEKEEVSGGE